MTQFDVYRNPNPASAKTIPYLLDVQSDLLSHLITRVVAPLSLLDVVSGKTARQLNPVFEIAGERFVLLIQEMAGVPIKPLGKAVANLQEKRADILAALDVVFSGV